MIIDHLRTIAAFVAARITRDEKGASMVEYALLLALIAVVCIAAVTLLGQQASQKFTDVGNAVTGA